MLDGRQLSKRRALDTGDLQAREAIAKEFCRLGAYTFGTPRRKTRYPFLAASLPSSVIRSEPATRSGSGVRFRPEAQTRGAPSATMNAACSLIALRSARS